MSTLADLFNDFEKEHLAQIARDEARRNTPAEQARLSAKKAEEHERGVRLGWWTEDGTPIEQPEEDDDENEGEE